MQSRPEYDETFPENEPPLTGGALARISLLPVKPTQARSSASASTGSDLSGCREEFLCYVLNNSRKKPSFIKDVSEVFVQPLVHATIMLHT
eukprot:scaffold8978_cov140-Skeletonema_marinoi.AAC.6